MSGAGDNPLEEERAQRARLTYIRQELLAPAGAIVGYAELLHEEAAGDKLEDMLPDLARVLDACHNLYSMFDRLLAGEAAQDFFHGQDAEAAQQKLRHDLRTPINGIKGYGEMLLEDLEDFGATHLRDDFEKSLKEVTNMLARLSLIADFSRTGTEKNGSP
jgi:adenylate cyclase